mmetsp:Transcript_10809/g.33121  ORF Transcript_10809/g.33121 Transcript_10809/m.33121 type:complete len:281 (-) Transcript_10809:2433-3275(-)
MSRQRPCDRPSTDSFGESGGRPTRFSVLRNIPCCSIYLPVDMAHHVVRIRVAASSWAQNPAGDASLTHSPALTDRGSRSHYLWLQSCSTDPVSVRRLAARSANPGSGNRCRACRADSSRSYVCCSSFACPVHPLPVSRRAAHDSIYRDYAAAAAVDEKVAHPEQTVRVWTDDHSCQVVCGPVFVACHFRRPSEQSSTPVPHLGKCDLHTGLHLLRTAADARAPAHAALDQVSRASSHQGGLASKGHCLRRRCWWPPRSGMSTADGHAVCRCRATRRKLRR